MPLLGSAGIPIVAVDATRRGRRACAKIMRPRMSPRLQTPPGGGAIPSATRCSVSRENAQCLSYKLGRPDAEVHAEPVSWRRTLNGSVWRRPCRTHEPALPTAPVARHRVVERD